MSGSIRLERNKATQWSARSIWRTTEILIAPDRKNGQQAFDFLALSDEEFDKRQSSGLARAAEHFVRTEIKSPIYFGREMLSDVSSYNVDQYLEVAGEVFEEITAKIQYLRDNPVPLTADRQDSIIREVAKSRWEGLVRRLPRGREARTLLEGIGAFCQAQTFRESAPYVPGVTGIAITMQDRETLIDSPDDKIRPLLGLRVCSPRSSRTTCWCRGSTTETRTRPTSCST
jgi:hypothetical protein